MVEQMDRILDSVAERPVPEWDELADAGE